MDESENDIILDIKVKYEDAIAKIEKYRNEISRAKEDQKLFKEELKNGELTEKEYSKSMIEANAMIKQRKASIRMLEKEVENNIKIEEELTGSYNSLSAELYNLKNQYKSLSAEQREGNIGQALAKQINEVNDQLKEADADLGVFTRDVGNYEASILKAAAGNNSFAQSLLSSTSNGKGFGGVIDLITTKAKAFFSVIIANPIIAILAVITGAVMLLVKAFQRSEENGTKLNIVMSKLSSIFNFLLKALEPVASFVVDTLIVAFDKLTQQVEKTLNGIAKVLEFLGMDSAAEFVRETTQEVKEMAKASSDLAKAEADLTKQQRESRKVQLDYQKRAEKLRQIRDDETKTIQERIQANEDLGIVLQEQLKAELSIAEKALEVANLRVKIEGATAQNLDAQANALTTISDIQERITGQQSEQLKNLNTLRKESADKAKETRSKELEAIRQYEDSVTQLITNEIEKQRREVQLNYNRQIEDLKAKLKTETNLSKSARKAINDTIINLEKQRNADLDKISIEELNKQTEIQKQNITNRLAVLKAESSEALKLRIQSLEIQRDEELKAAEKTGIDVSLIRAKYQKQIDDENINAQKQVNEKLIKEQQLYIQNKIEQARLLNQQTFDLEIGAKQAEIEALKQLEEESDAEFLSRKIALESELKSLTEQRKQYEINTQKEILSAYETMFGALSDFMQEFAENSSTLSAFSKVLAAFEIGLNTAKAISAGIAAAQSVPFPGNLAAIATTIATILGNMAQAKKLLTSEKQPETPSFATGGLVTGPGSGTSDSISARLSNGESVITARATQMFSPILSAFNQIGGGVPISTQDTSSQIMGEEMLTRAFAKAIGLMPNPVVSVQEIDSVNNRVAVLERMRKL